MATPPVPEAALDETARLYLSGLSVRAVAKKLGLSYTATHHRLALAGVTMRGRGGRLV
jgi:transcriptional regulator of aromatic amino acid metabolism